MIQAPPRTIKEVWESLPEGTLAQVINNQLVMSPAPTSAHQRTVKAIFLSLHRFVEAHNLGEVFFAPIDVQLNEHNIYQPDILFIAKDKLHIVGNIIKGVPNLIVEVLSKGSDRLDKVEKMLVYEQTGVQEYWIVDPITKEVTGYKLIDESFGTFPSKAGEIKSDLLQTAIQF